MTGNFPAIERGQRVAAEEIEILRLAVGWDRAANTFERVLRGSFSYYTARTDGILVGFLNVISDGVGDAFLQNLTVHPEFQKKGIGKAIVSQAVNDLSNAGIQCIQVVYAPELEAFCRKCGFDALRAGIIDNASPGRAKARNAM